MAGNRAENIMAAHRSSHAPDEEPLMTDTRKVRDIKRQPGRDPDLGVNLAALFRDVAGVEQGDEVTVEIYEDRYVIIPEADE